MKKIVTLLLLLLGSLSLFSQTIYYVKTTGSDANDGRSWATAFRTVQKALATITSGQVWVATGTYYPDEGPGQGDNSRNSYFNLKNNVALYGGFAGTETALNQRNLRTRPTTLSGDLLKNDQPPFINYGDNAYNVVIGNGIAGAVLDGFTIMGGSGGAPGGAGIRINSSSVTLANCRFMENTTGSGGGLYMNIGSLTAINCSFIGNRSSVQSGGAAFITGHADEYHDWYASASFTNCSFVSNSAESYGGGIDVSWRARVSITNSIFWGNSSRFSSSGNAQIDYGLISERPQVTYSIVQGGWGGTGNLSADPLFVSPAVGDYRLQFCSPAIEAGNTAVVTTAIDLNGAPRIAYHKVDMGAYESQESRVLYVKAGATGKGTGRSWLNAFTSVQDALAFTSSCQSPLEIWVAAGTYYPDVTSLTNSNLPTASFQLRNNVALYGGFAGTETALDQRNLTNNMTILSGEIQQDDDYSNNAYHVVSSASVNTTAVLDGFIITGGNASAPDNTRGGGLYNVSSSPTISNCSFAGNRAVEGGALYNNAASPVLTNCYFSSNQASYGGGIYNYINAPVMSGCSFSDNTASTDGGGIYNHTSSSTLVNCSFWNNQAAAGAGINNFYSSNVKLTNCSFGANMASDGGGLFNWASSPTLINCILWGNTTAQISGDDAIVTYSIVQGGYNGTGNKAADPQFIDAAGGFLQLRGCSPAVNSATATGAPAADIDGKPRPSQGGYDMGAYELQGNGAPSIFFVDKNAAGPVHDGSSWTNAFTSLQAAIDQAATCLSPSQVWVAAGTYYPDATGTNREASFVQYNNVSVYGGFTGTELPGANPPPPRTNKTVLSGEIQQDGNAANNSYHVVQSLDNDSTALLDGFTITGGNADGNGVYPENSDIGGGILNVNSFPSITNCIITSNHASSLGGGVGNTASSFPVLTTCLLYNNSAKWGGGIANEDFSNSTIISSTLSSNTAERGGAIYSMNASPRVTNSILWGNTGGQIGSAQGAYVTYSIVQDGYYPGAGNKTEDPRFVAADNRHLQKGSPAIDAGNMDLIATVFSDLDGTPRVQGGQVDMGAYEFPQGPLPQDVKLLLRCPASFTLFSDPDQCGTAADFTGDHAATTKEGKEPIILTYAPAPGTLLPVGENTITVTASDAAGETLTCSFTVTVVDETPPVISCPAVAGAFAGEGQPVVKATNTDGCAYRVQGSELDVQASDNCPTPLTYFFSLGGATTSGGPLEASSLEGMELRPGRTTITWLVQDAAGNQSSCTFEVLVIDRTAPVISTVSVNTPVLYPPNHQMRDINLTYDVTDYCGELSTTLSVTSNEPQYGTGSGDTGPDWEIIDNHKVKLRAERSGSGNGRVYTITVTAKDAAGNESQATTTVTVPHDKGAPVTINEAVHSKEVGSLIVNAVPNPSANGFTLQVQSPSALPLTLRVTDAAGRVVEQRTGLTPNGVLYLGATYRPGVYHVQVLQGNARQTIKLVKQAR